MQPESYRKDSNTFSIKNQCLFKGSAWQLPKVWTWSTSRHAKFLTIIQLSTTSEERLQTKTTARCEIWLFGTWPLHCDKQGRCNLCPKGVSRWKYQKCNVFLCLNTNQDSFVTYHQKKLKCSKSIYAVTQMKYVDVKRSEM